MPTVFLTKERATDQRAILAIFHDMMHIDMEVYVDDILVKSADHANALRRVLQRSREHQLQIQPQKCVLGEI